MQSSKQGKNNLISIIVPIFNAEKYIRNCLDSILNQTYNNIEIIIVDDCSTDNSIKICEEYNSKRIKIYKNTQNHGPSYSRNIGILKSLGEYIMFIDADDIVDSRLCETLINNLTLTNSDISICGYKVISNHSFAGEYDSSKTIKNSNETIIKIFNDYKGYLWNKLYKKSIIQENNICLNEKIYMCEDLLFNLEYLLHTAKSCYTNSKLYGYYVSNASISTKTTDKWFSVIEAFKMMEKIILQCNQSIINNYYCNYLHIMFEVRCRCKNDRISFSNILQKYGINYKTDILNKYKQVMHNSNIQKTEKVKLFFYYRLFLISYNIKRKRR